MFTIGYSLIKRIIFYMVFSLLWGFMFTFMLSFASGLNYNYSYFLDSVQNTLIMLAVSTTIFEIFRIIVIKKYSKIKQEIIKENIILFDKPSNLEINMKAIGGWLFLTDKNIIFRSLKKKKPQNLIIPINSIQNINKIKLAALTININNIVYKFIVSKRDYLFDLLTLKTSQI